MKSIGNASYFHVDEVPGRGNQCRSATRKTDTTVRVRHYCRPMGAPHGDRWSGQRLDDADCSHARLHSPNFEGVKITDGWLANADISAFIGGLHINGVMIAPPVTAELDRMFPERILLRADDPKGWPKPGR